MLNPLTAVAATGSAPDGSVTSQAKAAPVNDQQSSTAGKAASTANPSYRLDLGLNLVVLQFHDPRGDVTQSIPSERQLRAYRDGGSATGDAAPVKG